MNWVRTTRIPKKRELKLSPKLTTACVCLCVDTIILVQSAYKHKIIDNICEHYVHAFPRMEETKLKSSWISVSSQPKQS